jgi:hypothetical protein
MGGSLRVRGGGRRGCGHRGDREDVGGDHGGGDVLVAEEFLDGEDVGAVPEEVGGEGVAERVAGDPLGDGRGEGGVLDGALEHGLVEVVGAALAGLGVEVGPGAGYTPTAKPTPDRRWGASTSSSTRPSTMGAGKDPAVVHTSLGSCVPFGPPRKHA